MGLRHLFFLATLLCIFGGVGVALYQVLNRGVEQTTLQDTTPAPVYEEKPVLPTDGAIVGKVGTLSVRARDAGNVTIRDTTNDPSAELYIAGESPYYYVIQSKQSPSAYTFAFEPSSSYFNIILASSSPRTLIETAEREFMSYFAVSDIAYCQLDVKRVRALGNFRVEDIASAVCSVAP